MKAPVPRKRFGQHFLCDSRVLDQIVSGLSLQLQDRVVEIGPGLGALTKRLLPHLQQLNVIELDRDLIAPLKKACSGSGGVLIVHAMDVLQVDFASLTTQPNTLRVVGNLPYNISTPLLFHLLQDVSLIRDIHVMLQKEVADRLVAQPSEGNYGRLSVMIQYYCQAEFLFSVPPEAFRPPPKVQSAMVRLIPHRTLPDVANDPVVFAQLVRQAFMKRRKTLQNALKGTMTADQIRAAGIDPVLRPQQLSVADYVRLSHVI